MKRPTLAESLATKAPKPQPSEATAAPEPPAAVRLTDSRMATTVRIEPEKLEALKIVAAKRRVKVNDLILEGVSHVLALYAPKQ